MKNLFSLFILLLFIIACSPPRDTFSQIGEQWVNSTTKVYFIDTLTVNAATIQFDSLDVTNATRFLAGAYTDPVLGYTEAKIFSQLSNTVYEINDNALYDSIAVILKYDGYAYNDTLPLQKINVFRVTEDIKKEEGSFYNTMDFEIGSEPLGSHIFEAEPDKDSLHITIDTSFGQEIFEQLQENEINNSEEFNNEYQGLSIQANPTNTTILGFTKGSLLRIYYHLEEDEENEERTLDIGFNTVNSFSKISSNREGTILEPITDQLTVLPSKETENMSFIQAGTGLVTRIDIPHLPSLKNIGGQGTIVSAILKFTINPDAAASNLFTRGTIQGFIVDRKANILANLSNRDLSLVIGSIENESSEFNEVTYQMNIMNFIDIKQLETNEEYYLVLYPQNFITSVDRYLFNGDNLPNEMRMKLELTYAVYDE